MPQSDSRAYARAVLADKPLFYWTFDEPVGPAFEQVRHLVPQALLPTKGLRRCSHAAIGSGLALGCAADFTEAVGCFSATALGQGIMPGAWAIEFWMQSLGPRSGRLRQCLLSAGIDGHWGSKNPAVMFVRSEDGSKNELQLCWGDMHTHGGPALIDDRWHHVMLVFYGKPAWGFGVAPRVDVVLDGQRSTVDRGEFTSAFDLMAGLSVGADGEALASAFCGRLDELAFYDLSKLTVKEIETRATDMAKRHFRAAQPQNSEP